MSERCEWCNHKAPNHDPLCCKATSADRTRHLDVTTHEEAQHHAAYGGGADPGAELQHRGADPVVSTGDCTCGCGDIPGPHHAPSCKLMRWTQEVHTGPAAAVRALADTLTYGKGAYLTTDKEARKHVALATGLFDYFPDALAAVAETSYQGSKQHHPDKPVHWDRPKSNDHDDCLLRHFLERGTVDVDGIRHSAKVAWRALAILQLEIEAARE